MHVDRLLINLTISLALALVLGLVTQRLGLSPFEQDILLLCAAMELDTRIPALCARAQDDPARPYPTFALALVLFLPFDGLAALYILSALFGLVQGGLVPSYAVIVREFFPPEEAGVRVSTVLMATVFGMALGGWITGVIFDLTGSYQAAFLHGISGTCSTSGFCSNTAWLVRIAR